MERAFADKELLIQDVSKIFKAGYDAVNKDELILSQTGRETEEYLQEIGISTKMPVAYIDIPSITYHDAMEYFGSDKPDLRFQMPLLDAKSIFIDTDFKIFADIAKDKDKSLKAIVVKDADKPEKLSRRKIKDLEKFVIEFGAKGLAYFQCKEEDGKLELKGPLCKMLTEQDLIKMEQTLKLEIGDIVFFGAGEKEIVLNYMGRLRIKIAEELELIEDKTKLLWVVDFPMFEVAGDGSIKSMHHPFTAPLSESWEDYKAGKLDVLDILSDSYDLVMNGVELGGGSVRIHDQDLQYEIFKIMGLDEESIKDKFSYFIEALSYGTPPHAGFAFGFDRLVSLLLGKDTIREVIAFPKAQSSVCPMTDSPDMLGKDELKGLGLRGR